MSRIAEVDEKPGDHLWVSELAGCLRRAFYDRTSPVKRAAAVALKAVAGRALHELLARELEREGCEAEKRIDIVISDVRVTGKADAVCGDAVIEVKTVENSDRVMPDHERQARYYAAILNAREAYVLLIDRDRGTWSLNPVRFDRARTMQELARRAKTLWEAVRKGKPPKPERGPWCTACQYRLRCSTGKR